MMSTRRLSKIFPIVILLVGLFAAVIAADIVQAQEPQPQGPTDNEVNAIAKQLYCPVCENTPLDVCPTQACAQWRELIREKLGAGWTEDEIKTYFVNQYGDRVLAEPPRTGWNWLVYIIPPLVILGGIYILYRAFRSWSRSEPEQDEIERQQPEVEAGDEYVARIEDELRQR
ncbi:MAG: cytochrome c-type biogenesis protein CcmH [Anaerolineales bacterium]|nr:cytochrome c-type biogenesis protein CcmH [Anaerolineales bacterium]